MIRLKSQQQALCFIRRTVLHTGCHLGLHPANPRRQRTVFRL
jgi:hypothetical protein